MERKLRRAMIATTYTQKLSKACKHKNMTLVQKIEASYKFEVSKHDAKLSS